ncbi:MAG: DUF3592 domain-containing protein [Spirochaetota bacterium]
MGQKKRTGAAIIGRALRLVSLLFLGIAVSNAIGTWLFLQNARSTEGVVVDMEVIENPVPLVAPETGRVYYPVIEFTDETDTRYVVETRRGVRSPELSAGDAVPILYRPGRPESARMDTLVELWGASAVFGLLSLISLFVGLVAPFGFADIRGHRRSVSPVWKEEDE